MASYNGLLSLQWLPSWEKAAAFLTLIIAFQVTCGIYRAYFDSLSSYPGPKLWAATIIPESIFKFRGTLDFKLAALHEKYGPVVRTSPRTLSYSTGDAWRDIYNVRPQMKKNEKGGPPPNDGIYSLVFDPDDDNHARYRRNFAHGFSEKSLRDQEFIIKIYVDLLVQKMCEHRGKINLGEMFGFVTVDIIGDLTFGESFRCLEECKMNSWVQNMFAFVKAFIFVTVVYKFEPFDKILLVIGKHLQSFRKIEIAHRKVITEKLGRRLKMDGARQDFMTHVLKHTGAPDGMTNAEIEENSQVFIIAGAETSASFLTGLLYHLLCNRIYLDRLVREIRNLFSQEHEINMANLPRLPYLAAVIQEGLRIFPPAPQGVQRVTPKDGAIIAGGYVCGSTLVGVNHWAAYHSSTNFKNPNSFVPERWLGDEKYKDDRRDCHKPFSVGPRNCIGQALAMAEIKLIVTRLFWNFDIELCDESKNWLDEAKTFGLWEKGPLMVTYTPAVRD